MKHALHAEWTKLRTLPAPGLVLAAIVLLAAAGGAWHPAAGQHAAQILAGVLARLAPGYGDTAVTAAWATAALLAGGLALGLRDV